jgi:hypothetical protein
MGQMKRALLLLVIGALIAASPFLCAQGVGPGTGGGESEAKGDESKNEEVTLPTLNYDAPEIKKIEERIRERFEKQLKKILDDGKVGLNNQGYVELRADAAKKLELKEKNEIKKAIEAENKDRDELIKTVAKVNNLAKEQEPLLRKSYIKAYREKALPGWWSQADDKVLEDGTVQKGKWAQKPQPKEEGGLGPSGENK